MVTEKRFAVLWSRRYCQLSALLIMAASTSSQVVTDDGALARQVSALAAGASQAQLDLAIARLSAMKASVASKEATLPPLLSVHKHTYATADPEAAVQFVAAHLGGGAIRRPEQPCGQIRQITLGGSVSDLDFHFVFNPNKLPGSDHMNATEIGRYVDEMRGNFGVQTNGTGKFDQFMDNHLGIVVESLDPYVANWEDAGVPFICRTWCCAPGMPQYPQQCPSYSIFRTDGCEVGCYVEIPSGIIVELQCGLNSYNESLSCLTKVLPDVFDICEVESADENRNGNPLFL